MDESSVLERIVAHTLGGERRRRPHLGLFDLPSIGTAMHPKPLLARRSGSHA
jgi:hypothetical protein